MAENVGYATLQIIPSFRGLDAALRAALGGVGPGAGAAAGAGFASSFAKALKIGAPLALGAAVGAGFIAASKAAADFEFRIDAVGAVSGATGSELDALREKALQLGKDTAFTATESAQAMEELVKAGLSVEQVLNGGADAAVALAAAGEVDLGKAATIASQSLNAFRLEAEELPGVADTIAGAANSSAIDVEQFGYSLSQTAASAAIAGISFEDTATAIALLGNAGIVGSDAGTSLKTMFARLTPQTDKQKEAMEALGIITEQGTNQFYDQEGSLKSLSEIAGILQYAFAGLTKQDISTYLYKIFGSDAIRAGAVLLQEGAAGVDALAESIQKISAEDVAAARLDNLTGDVEKLKGAIETFLIEGGTPLNEWLRTLVQDGTAAVNWLNDPPTEFTDWLRNAWQDAVRLATPIVEDLVQAGRNLQELAVGLAHDLRPLAETLLAIGGVAIVGGLTVIADLLERVTGFVADNRGAVVAAVAAWAAWKAAMITAAAWSAVAAGIQSVTAAAGSLRLILFTLATTTIPRTVIAAGAFAGVAAAGALVFVAFQKSAQNAERANEDFLDSLDIDRSSAKDMLRGLNDINAEIQELNEVAQSGSALEGAWQVVNPFVDNDIVEASDRINDLQAEVDALAEQSQNLFEVQSRFDLSEMGMKHWIDELDLDPATMSVEEMGDAIREAQDLSSTGAPATEDLATAYRTLQNEASSATDQLDAFKDALDAIIGTKVGFEEAQLGFASSLQELASAVSGPAAAAQSELRGQLDAIEAELADTLASIDRDEERARRDLEGDDLTQKLQTLADQRTDAYADAADRRATAEEEASARAAEALSAWSTNLGGSDEASIRTREMIAGLVTDAIDLAVAFGEAGGGVDGATEKLMEARAQIVLAGEAAGISREQMLDYVNSLGLTPENVSTLLELEGVDAVQAAIDATTQQQAVDVSAALDAPSWAVAQRYIGQTTEPKTIDLLAELDPASRATAERYIGQLTQDRTIKLLFELDPVQRAIADRYIQQGQAGYSGNRSGQEMPQAMPFTPENQQVPADWSGTGKRAQFDFNVDGERMARAVIDDVDEGLSARAVPF